MRTTNGLKNLNRQIKRRTRVANLFPNEESLLRLATAVVMEISDEWESGRTCLTMKTWLGNGEHRDPLPHRTEFTEKKLHYPGQLAKVLTNILTIYNRYRNGCRREVIDISRDFADNGAGGAVSNVGA